MFDFNSLDIVRKKAEIKGDKKQEQFYHLFDNALEKFRKLVQTQNFDTKLLKEIAYQLLESLKLVKNKAEPYLFLAYIFYIIGDNQISIKYLKVSSLLNPYLDAAERLREAITSERVSLKINYQTLNSDKTPSTDLTANKKRGPPRISQIRRIERK